MRTRRGSTDDARAPASLADVQNRVRLLRAEQGWSQAELAERLNVSRQTINSIETGKYDPSLPLAFESLGYSGCRLNGSSHRIGAEARKHDGDHNPRSRSHSETDVPRNVRPDRRRAPRERPDPDNVAHRRRRAEGQRSGRGNAQAGRPDSRVRERIWNTGRGLEARTV